MRVFPKWRRPALKALRVLGLWVPRMTLPERAQQSQGKGSATMIIFRALCACTEVQCPCILGYTKRVLSKTSKWVTSSACNSYEFPKEQSFGMQVFRYEKQVKVTVRDCSNPEAFTILLNIEACSGDCLGVTCHPAPLHP